MEGDPFVKSFRDESLEVSSDDAERDESTLLAQPYQVAMESKRVRFLPVFELLLPTATIWILYVIGDWQYTGAFHNFVKKHQTTVQIVVQVVSHVLAMLQVSSICAVLNLSTRHLALHRSAPLQDYSLWIALSNARIDVNLPSLRVLVTAAFTAATFLPGALWAGTLSPSFVLKSQEIGGLVLPAFTDRTKAIWDSQYENREGEPGRIWNINDHCILINDARGLLPSCPVLTLQGLLLLSASSATTLDGGSRKHSKLENPNWQYIGRSYGVGSSVGLWDDQAADDRVLHYSYTEFGYIANVSCIKNSTSDFHLRLMDFMNRTIPVSEYQETHHPEMKLNQTLPDIWSTYSVYFAEGYLPNSIIGSPELYPSFSWHEFYENITAWAAVANDKRNMIAVAAGTNLYQNLNQTQCEVYFRPMAFDIAVNREKKAIAVELKPSIQAEDIEPTGHLQANVMRSINLLSRMSPSLYVSVLGETLSRNVEKMQRQRPELNLTEAVTSAVAESFTAMIDDIMVAYGASQIANAADTTTSTAHGVVEAVQVGQPFYRNLVIMYNFLIVFIVGFEAARTMGWRGLTVYNYLDFKSNVIAASAGGSGIAKAVWEKHRSQGTQWVGDPNDAIASTTGVRFDSHKTLVHTETIAIVNASESEGECDTMQARKRKGSARGRPIALRPFNISSRAQRAKSQ